MSLYVLFTCQRFILTRGIKMEKVSLEGLLDTFSEYTKHPVNFLAIDTSLSEGLKSNIKDVYDFIKNQETNKTISKLGAKSLKKLFIENFDLEQIWQQIELQNDEVIGAVVKNLSTLLIAKKHLILNSLIDQLNVENDISDEAAGKLSNLDGNSSSSDSISSSDVDEYSNKGFRKGQANSDHSSSGESCSELEDMEQDILLPNKNTSMKQKCSIVDDDFFKLNEMEDFLEKEERPVPDKKLLSDSEDDDEEGSVDLFEEDSEQSGEDDAKTARFKDYFVAHEGNEPKPKRNRLMQELDEDESESEAENEDLNNEIKSTLELRGERLKIKIKDLEDQAISEKPWQLKGEITAKSRPQNSLLGEIVEFDLSSRPAPIVTEQTSLQLEDIIRQRIKHKTFDNVEKISRPVETPLEYKKKLVLDQEKSKESLANIYEKEYLEQQANLDKDKMDIQEKEPEIHKEVKKLMKNLFTKLDALSNFHFTSTPAIPELKIVSNLPAVNMEEVAPVASSDAALLAPEEVRNKPKGDIIGKHEKTSTDKKRERRKKKLKQKIHSKRKAKINNNVSKNTRVKA